MNYSTALKTVLVANGLDGCHGLKPLERTAMEVDVAYETLVLAATQLAGTYARIHADIAKGFTATTVPLGNDLAVLQARHQAKVEALFALLESAYDYDLIAEFRAALAK